MGYTHYWYLSPKITKPAFDKVKTDIRKIVKHGVAAGVLGGWDGGDSKVITKKEIRFNGIGDEGCEDFYLPNVPKDLLKDGYIQADEDGFVFNFCKTRGRDYDIYVVACIAVLKSHLHDLVKCHSDGSKDELIDGVNLAAEILGWVVPDFK
jgi:hypothetical protein